MIEGNYKFKIWKKADIYFAKCFKDEKKLGITDGETEEEIFEMIADFYMSVDDVKVSGWSKFWHRILKLS